MAQVKALLGKKSLISDMCVRLHGEFGASHLFKKKLGNPTSPKNDSPTLFMANHPNVAAHGLVHWGTPLVEMKHARFHDLSMCSPMGH